MASAGPQPSLAPPAKAGEIPALDGFRAIAIGLVMLSHVGMERVVPGQFGVTLFFFLSGYLITTLLRREFDRDGSISLKAFYFRRAVRILPPLAFALALATALSLAGLIWPLFYPGLVTDALFLSNYFPLSGVPIGLWSLAVEEHFYLVFPAVALFVMARGGAGRCAILCAFACVLTLGVRLHEVAQGEDFANVAIWTHTRIDSILFGAILACWNNPVVDAQDRLPGRWTSYAIAFTLLAAGFIFRDETFRHTYRYTIQGIALIFLFNAAIRDRGFARRFLDHPLLRIVALLSYTLYLVHSPIVEAARPFAKGPVTPFVMAAALAVSFAVAAAVYVAMEKPLARWRRDVERRWRMRAEAVSPQEDPDSLSPGGLNALR
ncbi:acyltransferase family protein [Qipengyuania sediminis]|uniref:acyltransferase family protein n=1 Tax=Qipengyuania sediminis TaxID=1532023 RepID=UPI001059946B|nr:acyltransferase [Qipengyuania sediminis]